MPAMTQKPQVLLIAGDAADGLNYPMYRMEEEGYNLTIAAPEKKIIKTVIHQYNPENMDSWGTYTEDYPGQFIRADTSIYDISPESFDALILPPGRAPEHLRTIPRVNEITRHFIDSDKPIQAICHAPLLLLSAGIEGRRLSGVDVIEPVIKMSENTFEMAPGDAVVDGNIVTGTITPDTERSEYPVVMRKFIEIIEEEVINEDVSEETQQRAA